MNRTKSLAVCAWGGVKGLCMRCKKSALFAVVSALFAVSCNNALLPEPEIEQIQGAVVNKDAQIEAPLTVKATQGKTRNVTISWSTSNGATQYIIYSAASPHEEFRQIAETKGEVNSIDIQEPAGTSAYYRVCARNYKKELSDFSDTVFGSTMATPIISSITSSTDGTAATVSWWMENCSPSTYQSLVNYVVYCYDESGNEVAHETASGEQTSAVLSGLTAKTRYFYQVEAFISADQSKPEYSDKVDEETARRLIPDAPENLSATQGTDTATIAISWMLPQFCDVAVSGGVYERHPLYFTVERKLKGDDDTKYQKIVTYLGTQKASALPSVMHFSCNADGAAASEENAVSVQAAAQSDADAERSDNYPDYISRSTITYCDTTAERGRQYEYRVRSYVDDVKKTISADSACATADGFLLSKPSFSASAKYARAADDNNIITKITVSFKTVFEPFGQDYSYVLCRNFEPMETENGLTGESQSDVIIASASSTSALNTETDVFDFGTGAVFGYYQYVLYICASGERDITRAYDRIVMGGKITVIDDASKLPTVTRFDIQDGYADKFRLTWNYDENCSYRLEWKSSLDGFAEVRRQDVDKDTLNINDGTATYDHAAQSGEVRTYTLVANGGIEVSKTYPLPESSDAGVPEPKQVETLGTAVPQTQDIGYRTISVLWPNVQKATGTFGIKAYYKSDAGKTDLAAGKYEITKDDDSYHCVITDPDGFDDPKRSGLPITMEITATSEIGDTTTATHTVCTLGPAALNVHTNETPAEEAISLTWNKAEGAEGYLIYRLSYTDRTCAAVDRTSCYYYRTDGSLTVLGDFDSEPNAGNLTRAQVTSEGNTYALTDSYREPTAGESAYQSVQSKLCWGLPYGYIVLPVKDSADFEFGENSTMLGKGEVDYTANGRTLEPTIGSTLGYGLNLVADKAMSGKTQGIRWEEPYKALLPVVYRRAADSTDTFDKFTDDNAMQGKNATNMQIRDRYYDAFEYVVKYYSSYPDGSPIELPPSLLAQIKKNAVDYDTPQGKKTELNNKGYLLTLDGFDAQHHPDVNYDYYEQISWKEWDYTKRAIGPDFMTVRVQNNNIDADFHDLVRIEKANARAGLQSVADDIKAENEGAVVIRVAPAGIAGGTKGTTDGLLKVLRDYKHNYTFTLKRGETPVAYEDYEKTDYIKSAYRQITDEEMVRAATLAMAYGIQQTGTNWQTHLTGHTDIFKESYPGGGQTEAYRKGGTTAIVKLLHNFTFTNFSPAMPTRAGEKATFLTVNGTMEGYTGDGGSEGQKYAPRKYQNGSFTVTAAEDCGGLYNAIMTISSLTVNGTSGIKVKYPADGGEVSFGNITPFAFGNGNNKFAANPLADGAEQWQ